MEEEITDKQMESLKEGSLIRIRAKNYQEGHLIHVESPSGDSKLASVVTISRKHGKLWAILKKH